MTQSESESEPNVMQANTKVTVNSVDFDAKKANVTIETTIDGATRPINHKDTLNLDIGNPRKFASITHQFNHK